MQVIIPLSKTGGVTPPSTPGSSPQCMSELHRDAHGRVVSPCRSGVLVAGQSRHLTPGCPGCSGRCSEHIHPAMWAALGMEHGVHLAEVMCDGPAGKSGFRVGDVILEFDGESIADANGLRTARCMTDQTRASESRLGVADRDCQSEWTGGVGTLTSLSSTTASNCSRCCQTSSRVRRHSFTRSDSSSTRAQDGNGGTQA